MLFHSEQTIFFHSGKTVGTAIEKAFGSTHDPNKMNFDIFKGWDPENNVYLQHATPRFMKERIAPVVWHSYLKFTVVRNPYDRLMSVYYFLHDHHRKRFGSFEDFIQALPRVLRQDHLRNGSHYIPQHNYAYIGDERVVDVVLKFESIDSDFQRLCDRLGKQLTLTRYNTATSPARPKRPAVELYSAESVRIMQELYNKDFEYFGYSPEPPGFAVG